MRQFTIALVLVVALSAPALAGQGVITGVVTTKGETGTDHLIGVTVLLQGTVRGTTTNTKGEYRLTEVPAGKHAQSWGVRIRSSGSAVRSRRV